MKIQITTSSIKLILVYKIVVSWKMFEKNFVKSLHFFQFSDFVMSKLTGSNVENEYKIEKIREISLPHRKLFFFFKSGCNFHSVSVEILLAWELIVV